MPTEEDDVRGREVDDKGTEAVDFEDGLTLAGEVGQV